MAKEEIAGFYTRSRKFPKMIGRMTDGTRIWGGPYTLTQVGIGGVVLLILLITRTYLWSTGFVLFDMAVAAGVSWCVVKIVGYIPTFRRNLVSVFVDAVSAMFKPRGGMYQGRVVKLARPHQAVGKTAVLIGGHKSRAAADTAPMNKKAHHATLSRQRVPDLMHYAKKEGGDKRPIRD